MTPTERHEQDARIQSAALRHYAQKCRYAADEGGNAVASKDQLTAWAERADQLANAYDRLQVAFVDVGTITEYGLTQKLSQAVRVF